MPKSNRSSVQTVSKKMGNKNALAYGLYARDITFPWERPEDFENLYQDYRDEWKPNGCTEEQLVLKLAHYTQIEFRLMRSAQLRFFKSAVPEELKTGELTLEDMLQHQTLVPKHAAGALLMAKKFMEDLNAVCEHIRGRPYWTETTDGKKVQQELFHLQRDVADMIERAKAAVTHVEGVMKIATESAHRFDEAYQPDEIEKDLDRMAKIERYRQKVLQNLIAIKTYKREVGIEPTLLLESPSIEPCQASSANTPGEAESNDRNSTQKKLTKSEKS
jgi:hypothetical protein